MDELKYQGLNKEILCFVTGTLRKTGGHGLDHTIRVTRLCEHIGTAEKANLQILIPAALLHDIARPHEEETGSPHEIEGARISEKLLNEIGFNHEYIPAVIHAIKAHRYRSELIPETLEAMILSDADKLDAIGAVGIARAFMTAGEREGDLQDGVDHIHEKLLNLADLMYTPCARLIARKRHIFLENFVRTLSEELI